MSDDTEKTNVFKIVGNDAKKAEEPILQYPYIITDVDGEDFTAEGFLVFTSQHVAVMRDKGDTAIPVLVIPLHRVASAELLEEDNEEELPF